MRHVSWLALGLFVAACTGEVPIGAGTTDSGSDGGGDFPGDAASGADGGTSGHDSGPIANDSSSDVGTDGGGCTNLPGYPSAQGVYATIAGGNLQGTFAYTAKVVCGIFDTSWGAPLAGNYVSLGQGTHQLTQEFFLWTPGVSSPSAGMTYPLSAWFVVSNPPGTVTESDSSDPAKPGSFYTYPQSGGVCNMTYDEVTTTGCVRARFSCSGLVGSSTGQPINVTNGFVVCGASGP